MTKVNLYDLGSCKDDDSQSYQECLVRISILTSCKCRIQMPLEEADLWSFVKTKVSYPTNVSLLLEHHKKMAN